MSAGRGQNIYILDGSGNPVKYDTSKGALVVAGYDYTSGQYRALSVDISGQMNIETNLTVTANISGQAVNVSGAAVSNSGVAIRVSDSGGNMINAASPTNDGLVASTTNRGLNTMSFNLGYNDTDGNWKRVRVDQSGQQYAHLIATGGNPGDIFAIVVNSDGFLGNNFRGLSVGGFNLTYSQTGNNWNRMRGDSSGYLQTSVRVPSLGRSRGVVQVTSLSGGDVLASGDVKKVTLMMPSKSSGGVNNASGYVLVGYDIAGERPFIGGSGFEYNSGQGFMLLPGGQTLTIETANFNNLRVTTRFSGEFVSYLGEQY